MANGHSAFHGVSHAHGGSDDGHGELVMVVLVVGKKALPSKLCLHPLHFCKVPIKRALPGKVFKSQFPSARMRCSDLDLEQLGCLEGSLRLSEVVCVHM